MHFERRHNPVDNKTYILATENDLRKAGLINTAFWFIIGLFIG